MKKYNTPQKQIDNFAAAWLKVSKDNKFWRHNRNRACLKINELNRTIELAKGFKKHLERAEARIAASAPSSAPPSSGGSSAPSSSGNGAAAAAAAASN